MKALIGLARILVGLSFLFIGFIELGDPLGFAFKVEVLFGPEVFNFSSPGAYTLIIAIFIAIFKILLGLFLLLGYLPTFTRWALFLIVLFSTGLSFYTAYSGKTPEFSAFNGLIALQPWGLFIKNSILLVLVFFLLARGKHYIRPAFSLNIHKWIIFVVFIGCLGLTYYVLLHLPLFDFRPYKVGNTIQQVITTADAKNSPDFKLTEGGQDITDSILHQNKVLLIPSYNIEQSESQGWKTVKKAADEAIDHDYQVFGLTSSDRLAIRKNKEKYELDFPFFQMKESTLKSMIRSNPGLLVLENGLITQKLQWNDAGDLNFE